MAKSKNKNKIGKRNSIRVITPYVWNRTMVFDDPEQGLSKEALIAGADDLLVQMCEQAELVEWERGFNVLFSDREFPGSTHRFKRVRKQYGGTIYRIGKTEGWLCPALLCYFDSPPKRIYAQVKPADPVIEQGEPWLVVDEPQWKGGAIVGRGMIYDEAFAGEPTTRSGDDFVYGGNLWTSDGGYEEWSIRDRDRLLPVPWDKPYGDRY